MLSQSMPLYPLFDYTLIQIKASYDDLHFWLLDQLLNNFDKLEKSENSYENKKMYKRQLKVRKKFEKQLFENALKYIKMNHPCLDMIWTIQIGYLFTESIVESVCSVFKRLYVDNTTHMDWKTLRQFIMNVTMLPDDDESRTKIVQCVARAFFHKYGDGIIRDKFWLIHRKEVLGIVKSVVLDRCYKGDDSVFQAGLYLLDELKMV